MGDFGVVLERFLTLYILNTEVIYHKLISKIVNMNYKKDFYLELFMQSSCSWTSFLAYFSWPFQKESLWE